MADITSLLAALAGGGQGYLQTKERQRVRAQDDEDRRSADDARALSQLVTKAQLSGAGVIPASEATVRPEQPTAGDFASDPAIASALAAASGMGAAQRFRPVGSFGGTDYVQDTTADPMAQKRVAQHQADQRIAVDMARVLAAANKQHSPNARLVRDESGEYVWIEPPTNPGTKPVETGVRGYTPPKAPPRTATGPTNEDQTRKDLKDVQSQQIRAEHQLTGLKSERRSLTSDHPRAARPLPEQRTATDSAFARQYQGLGGQIDSAQSRVNRLTQSADSILNVLQKARTAPKSAPAKAGPDTSAIDAHISDDDIVEAMQQGAQSEDDVRHYVLQKYGIA